MQGLLFNENPSQISINLLIDQILTEDMESLSNLKKYLESNQQAVIMNLQINKQISQQFLHGLTKMENLAKLNLQIQNVAIKGDLLLQIIDQIANRKTLQSLHILIEESYIFHYSDDDLLFQSFSQFSNLKKISLNTQESFFEQSSLKQILNTLTASSSVYSIEYHNYRYFKEQLLLNDKLYLISDDTNTNYDLFQDIKASITQISISFNQDNINQFQNLHKLINSLQYLSELKTLKLELSHKFSQFNECQLIMNDIGKLQRLTQIDLIIIETNINLENLQQIIKSLSNLINLESIYIQMGHNEIIGEAFQDSELLFSKCSKLKSFFLILNNCGEEIKLQGLALGLQKAQNLQHLYLDFTSLQLQDEFAILFGNTLQKLIDINELRLIFKKNEITDEGIKSISSAIQSLKNLEQISFIFQDNKITENGYLHLKKTLQQQSNLKNIDQDFKWNKDLPNINNNYAETLLFENNKIRNLELSLRTFDQLSQNLVDQIQKSIQQSVFIETLILDTRKELFTLSTSKQPLPVKDLTQLKRLIIFSNLCLSPEQSRVEQYIRRKSLRLIELIITDYF